MNNSLKIPRSEGVTDAERYLKKLCNRSFLSMWSYTGIYNDKAKGQEVCDLLVVFDNHVIIFSDKDCKFPDTGNLQLDWSRWYRRAVKESAEQIYGAERWILSHPNRLFLDQSCTIPFPIDLPSPDKIKFHRIVVAHSASAHCAKMFGGSGSLMLWSELVGDDHIMNQEHDCVPYAVGQVNPVKGYVHIFDDTTLDIVLDTLDTVSDFVDYLTKKEKFLTGKVRVHVAGEEELLAIYLRDLNEENEHDFIIGKEAKGVDHISIAEGFWEDFSRSEQRRLQIQANEISYAWDALIETFSKHIIGGTSYYSYPGGINNQEKILRLLARESRTVRRLLACGLLEFLDQTPRGLKSTRMVQAPKKGGAYYVFLALPPSGWKDYEVYRKTRRELLEVHCRLVKLRFPEALDILGIATESGRGVYGSEDAAYLDARDWTEEQQKDTEQLQADMIQAGLISKYVEHRGTEMEYPDAPPITRDKNIKDYKNGKGRIKNQSCPCGSGRKFKKCHGTIF
ncbi:MAG: SEC-C domain-containing protein [Acidobacteriota bacterium]|nr:SEC-C domain-containing protein [Acidobacteriota bacterium]